MLKISVDQAALLKSLKRIGIGTVTGKSGNEQATKVMFRGKAKSTGLELVGTDGTLMVKSSVFVTTALESDCVFAVEASAFTDLVSHLDTGPLEFEYDEDQNYLRYKGSGTKVNLSTVRTDSFKAFDKEEKAAKSIGKFRTKDMGAGLDYASLFLGWSDDKDSKDPDSQILWVKNTEFVAGPGKVMGVFKCEHIPVEFKIYLAGVQAMLKFLKELTADECELFRFEEVFYFVKPVNEDGEVLMLTQSPRNPPMDSSPGEILDFFKSEESFKVDRDSLQRAIQRVRVVLGPSKVAGFKLTGEGNNAKLEVDAEDANNETSSAVVDVVRAGAETPVDFRLNYALLLSMMKLNSSPVLSVGLCPSNMALNIVEETDEYSMNALLGWVQQ